MGKILILVALAVILWSLGSALFHMASSKGDKSRVVRALTVRIALSVGLFVLLILAMMFGWIEPHDITPVSGNE